MSEIYKQKEYEIRSKMEDIDTISGTFEDYVREVDRFVGYLLNDTKEINVLRNQLKQKENIIKEVREYITSYESIETIQQFDHNKNNKDLDYSTIDEMTRRYMIVHDKLLEILDKESQV